MIDATKVHMMTKLAVYETKTGKKELKMHRYSRKNYLTMKILESFFAVTIVCALGAGIYIMRYYSNIMTEGLAYPYGDLIRPILVLYVMITVIDLLVIYRIEAKRYDRMMDHVKQYDKNLFSLKKYLEREDIS
ncbi:MAG: hypothetical protein LUF92_00100 [Clostridiales bacterium]|nr:hypothetical protein [Clostridiales bacterium]